MMNLDKFCYILIFSLLPILILPSDFLAVGMFWAGILFLFSLAKKEQHFLLLSIFIGISYGRIDYFAENLQKQTVYSTTEIIQIHQILKHDLVPTAIAKRENGDFIHLLWKSERPLEIEQKYQAELQLRPISARLNDGNFNRQRWYIARRISATASVKNVEKIPEQSVGIRSKWLAKTIEQTQSLNTQGLILALAFGERAWLKPEQWDLFQQTATAHLIAISGLHIGLAMGFGFWIGKFLSFGIGWICHQFHGRQVVQNPYFFAIFCGLLSAWSYSFLAGFAITTVRAVIAISFVMVCHIARRHYTPWQFWLRCVSLLILIDPISLLSDSFWLSILAVATLIFWYQYFPLKNLGSLTPNRWLFPLIRLIHLQIGILFCFLPVQLYFFDGLSFYAFLANLLIVPFYSLIIVPLILFSLGGLLQSWMLVDWLLQKSLTVLELFSHSWLILSHEEQWQFICVSLFCLSVIYFRKQLKSVLSLLIFCNLVIYQSYVWWQHVQIKPEMEWIHFDIGQGLAMAFVYFDDRGDKKAVLYDTGAAWEGGSMAEIEIIPYLKRQKIELDTIIISHDDNDHAGGVSALLAKYPQAKIISPGLSRYGENIEPCIAGKRWQFGKLSLSVIFPQQSVSQAKNEHSCIIIGEIEKYRLLLTGDSSAEQERQFAPLVGKVHFLQVGHHGSRTSTSYTLLANIRPEYAFISSARFNPWKMPHHSVIARLEELGVLPLNTAQLGMIKVKFYVDNYQISSVRNSFQPWYSDYFGK